MREIKFKFWDKKENKMYTNCLNLAISSNGNVSELKYHEDDYFSGVEWVGSAYSEHIIPLRYTGLKDKNGKEIYEGDIFNNGNFNVEIYYEESTASFLIRGGFLSGDDWAFSAQEIEIIGNIYETPKLLEEEKL